jgi:hypothetical protein
MKVNRVVEIYDKISEENVASVLLEMSSHDILNLLDDLMLNINDYPNELYDTYLLNKSQVLKLLNHMGRNNLMIDTSKFIYELNCYQIPK